MLRTLVLLTLFAVAALLVAPFLISSFLIDQRGVLIPGHVNSKREDVLVKHGNEISHSSEITIQYDKPNRSGVAYLPVQVSPDEYDAMPVGKPVRLHYLRPEDLPDLPLIKTLRKAQILPTVRLENRRAFTGFRTLPERLNSRSGFVLTALVLLLVTWRIARVPGFAWAVAIVVIGAGITLSYFEIPRPTPAPRVDVVQVVGRIKSLVRVDTLITSNRSSISADQPIQVLGIEFIPPGRHEPVLAMDLIDENSVPGLKENDTVRVDYERASPRTAYLVGARRTFFSRNLAGMATSAILIVIVTAVLLGAAHLIGKGYKRLTGTP